MELLLSSAKRKYYLFVVAISVIIVKLEPLPLLDFSLVVIYLCCFESDKSCKRRNSFLANCSYKNASDNSSLTLYSFTEIINTIT